jgi:hypothetical protein
MLDNENIYADDPNPNPTHPLQLASTLNHHLHIRDRHILRGRCPQGAASGKIRDIHWSSRLWNHESGVLVQIRLSAYIHNLDLA